MTTKSGKVGLNGEDNWSAAVWTDVTCSALALCRGKMSQIKAMYQFMTAFVSGSRFRGRHRQSRASASTMHLRADVHDCRGSSVSASRIQQRFRDALQ